MVALLQRHSLKGCAGDDYIMTSSVKIAKGVPRLIKDSGKQMVASGGVQNNVLFCSICTYW
jgi:hypothetical protein